VLFAENELEDRNEQLANEQAKCAELEEQVNTVLHAAQAFDLVQDNSSSSPHRQSTSLRRQSSSSSQPRTPSSASALTPGARPPSEQHLTSPTPLSPNYGGYTAGSSRSEHRAQRYDSTATTPRRASPNLPLSPLSRHAGSQPANKHDHDDGDDEYRGDDNHGGIGGRLRERMRQTPPRPSQSAPRPARGLGAILKGTAAFGGRSHNQGS